MPSGYRAPDALKDEFFSLLRQGVSVKEASARIGVWRSNTQRWLGKTGVCGCVEVLTAVLRRARSQLSGRGPTGWIWWTGR